MRKQFEEELRQKEMELERKEEMLQRLMKKLDGQEKGADVKIVAKKGRI